MRYRLVCLDAGFTLLSPRRTLADALAGVLAAHGQPVDEAELRAAWEAADRWFWEDYHRPENRSWTSDDAIDQVWRRYHGRMLEHLGREDATDLLDLVLQSQFAVDAWEPYPEAVQTLTDLGADPALRLGIVSDWGSNLPAIVAGLGLDRHLDFVLASAAVGLAKPDPAFFAMALERAGVGAGEALMVGDSYRADVVGARAAGMDAVLLDRPGESGADDVPIIRSLAELPALVRG